MSREKDNYGIVYVTEDETEFGPGEQTKIIFDIEKAVKERFKNHCRKNHGLSMAALLRQFIYQSVKNES